MRLDHIDKLDGCLHRLPAFIQQHSRAVAYYTQALTDQIVSTPAIACFGKDGVFRNADVGLLGRYHDVGKVGLANAVWESSAPLSPLDKKLIQTHPIIGAHLVTETLPRPVTGEETHNLWDIMAQCCLYHHERWDGKGYPFGLQGDEIPVFARIVGLADAFDAMTADRPYRRGVSKQEALQEIQREAGAQFDPVVADIFCALIEERGMVG